MTEEELDNAIRTNYPSVWSLINQPGVRDVLRQAIEGNWPSSRTQVMLQQTPYYTQTSDTQRQWDILLATDPATARQRGDAMTLQVLHAAQTLGIQLDPTQQWDMVTNALRNSWGAQEINHALLFGAAFTGLQTTGQGDIAGAAANVKALASNYGVPLSDQSATQWALGIKDGVVTSDSLTAYFIEQAKSRFPSLSAALDSGVTVKQYIDPYIQDAQQQLGVNPNDVNINDPKWSVMLDGARDDKGNPVAMSRDQWVSTLRTDPRYGYDQTSQGQLAATQLATGLSQKFGLI